MRSALAFMSLFIPFVSLASTPVPDYRLKNTLSASGVEIVVHDIQKNPVNFLTERGTPTLSLKKEEAYSLVITNNNPYRISFSLSLDSINPLMGKKSYQSQPGIILDSGKSYVLSQVKTEKKSLLTELFDKSEKDKWGVVLIFKEKLTPPMIGTGWPDINSRDLKYVADQQGVQHWVAPSGYPFRRNSIDPDGKVQFKYSVED